MAEDGGNMVYIGGAGQEDGLTLNGERVADFQAKYPGVDDGSKVMNLDGISADDIVGWGRELLMH